MRKSFLFIICLFTLGILNAQKSIPISTFEDLNTLLRNNLFSDFYLTNDIIIPEGTEWLPIGKPADWDGNPSSLLNFSGKLDGKGFSIKNLKITTGSDFSGLFARLIDPCVIKNLGLENVDILGGNPTGALSGTMFGDFRSDFEDAVTIENVFVTGVIKGSTQVGGIVGRNNNNPKNTIRNCYVNVQVEATASIDAFAGGIVGCLNTGRRLNINRVYVCGNIRANTAASKSYAGGIVGYVNNNNSATILEITESCVLASAIEGLNTGLLYNIPQNFAGTVNSTTNYALEGLSGNNSEVGRLNMNECTKAFFQQELHWDFDKIWEMTESDNLPVFSWKNVQEENENEENDKFRYYGFKLLDFLNERYYKRDTELYVETVKSQTLEKGDNAFLWPAAHIIRALSWGALLDEKYKPRLASFVNKIDWYKNGPGYGAIRNGQRFFDDNGLISYAIMLAYEKHFSDDQTVLDKALFAANYCLSYKDEFWGLPQTETNLNEGIFYLGPVNPMASAFAMLYTISQKQEDLDIATTYYDVLTDGLKDLTYPKTPLIYRSGSKYTDGVWTGNTAGPRAANTCGVAILGVRLYAITGDVKYLNEARAMTDAVLNRWYTKSGGFSEISMWGGNAVIDLLCELYEYDPNQKWYDAAVDIVNYLIDKGRDKSGFYPTGSQPDHGNWSKDRSNLDPPEEITVMSQACAANAILRLACLQDKMASGYDETWVKKSFKIYPNPAKEYIYVDDTVDMPTIEIYNLSGERLLSAAGNRLNISDLSKGAYIVKVIINHTTYQSKLIKN
ncbi:MAG TPA: T9SS type A sorting domain-containing protein [Paludibacter sp.]|jgi:hypothetical protein|nr:MAG: Immunoglobulin A1 protease precursor [Bacteroidetes bacterium ADurb.Bin174]HQB27521.1 T9SS type A sorting domain-containing protein [Paludibacter sp.]